jgi:hypothetical protein
LPVTGLVMSAWALLPPYSGPELNTETRVEVADHVVPSLVLIAVSAVALLLTRRKEASTTGGLVAGFLVALSGLWMVATHVPLVAQAARHEVGVTWGATAYHFLPSLAVLVLGLVWVGAYWSDAPA